MSEQATGVIAPKPPVLREVGLERRRQDERWGEQNHPNGTGDPLWVEQATWAKNLTDIKARDGVVTYLDILREEVYEAFAESDPAKLRTELIQVAAVAVAWVEKIDRDEAKR